MPFQKNGAESHSTGRSPNGTLEGTADPAVVAGAENVVVVIGTPVDEHLNPDPERGPRAPRACRHHLRDGQLLVLRSTVYPGRDRERRAMLDALGLDVDVAFCPERIAEGQRWSSSSSCRRSSARAPSGRRERASGALPHADRHGRRGSTPEEAELAKLFTNTWRYIKFATANQFFMMANDFGLDYERIRARHHASTTRGPPTCPVPGSPPGRACSRTRCSSRRSPTTTSCSVTRRCSSTRVCPSTSSRAWSGGSTSAH